MDRYSVRQSLSQKLAKQAKRLHSLKLARVAVSLEAHNPFNKVVAELDGMMEIIAKEEKEDAAQKAWGESEREENNNELDTKITNRESLEGEMVQLTDDIENEETGLKRTIMSWIRRLPTGSHWRERWCSSR